ncbi:MAG: branched-chain amino acid ABC transporter permease [Pseudomonadota bacterium]
MVFLQILLSGLTSGSLYALIALGFVLIYKSTEIVNFAQGELVMIGAYFALFFAAHNLPYYLVFPLAALSAFIVGMIVHNVVCRPLIKAHHLSVVIATFALSFLMRSIIRLIWGSQYYAFASPFQGKVYRFGSVVISPQNFWITIICLGIMVVFYFYFKFTKTGKSMSATAQNQDAASLMGVNINLVFTVIWGISAALGAASGILLAPITAISPYMGIIAIKAFAAAVLGGFNSLPGAVVGGLLLGIVETFGAIYISSSYKDIIAFMVLIAVLLIKPTGIFGAQEIKRA